MAGDRPDSELPTGLLDALSDPRAYPEAPEAVERRETLISCVFLVGPYAYKVRKAVVLPFVDYGTAERRREMATREVELGRRLAPGTYLGLVPIVQAGEGYAVGGTGPAVEHAVKMRRFDEANTLEQRLAKDEQGDTVGALGRLLADFHQGLPPLRDPWPPLVVSQTVEANFQTILDLPEGDAEIRAEAAHRFAATYLERHAGLLARRRADGSVRDGHGDLRAEHVILGETIEVFDPVEFDAELRRIDVAADLAFLTMDLERLGRRDLSDVLVDSYRAAGGDPGPDHLLAFYAAHRAWVRVKVALLRASRDGAAGGHDRHEAREYARLGRRLAWRARTPVTLVLCGPAASGKTVLASLLAEISGLPWVSSDVLRKAAVGLRPDEQAPQAAYSSQGSLETYAELGRRAGASEGTIVDATFRRASDRDAFRRHHPTGAPPPLFVECRAPAEVLEARARGRRRGPGQPSDAGAEIALEQHSSFERLDEVAAGRHVVVRTDRAPEEVVEEIEALLDHRLVGDAP